MALQKMIEGGVDVNSMVKIPSHDFRTSALFEAAINGEYAVVQLLLEKGATVDKTYGPACFTALYNASLYGYVEIVELLLRFNATPSVLTCDGLTPLYVASQEGQVECVDALLAAKAMSLELADQPLPPALGRHTALHAAAQNAHDEVVQRLLQYGVAVDPVAGEKETTPLMCCLYMAARLSSTIAGRTRASSAACSICQGGRQPRPGGRARPAGARLGAGRLGRDARVRAQRRHGQRLRASAARARGRLLLSLSLSPRRRSRARATRASSRRPSRKRCRTRCSRAGARGRPCRSALVLAAAARGGHSSRRGGGGGGGGGGRSKVSLQEMIDALATIPRPAKRQPMGMLEEEAAAAAGTGTAEAGGDALGAKTINGGVEANGGMGMAGRAASPILGASSSDGSSTSHRRPMPSCRRTSASRCRSSSAPLWPTWCAERDERLARPWAFFRSGRYISRGTRIEREEFNPQS